MTAYQPDLLDDSDIILRPEPLERDYNYYGCVCLVEGLVADALAVQDHEWFDSANFRWWYRLVCGKELNSATLAEIKKNYAII